MLAWVVVAFWVGLVGSASNGDDRVVGKIVWVTQHGNPNSGSVDLSLRSLGLTTDIVTTEKCDPGGNPERETWFFSCATPASMKKCNSQTDIRGTHFWLCSSTFCNQEDLVCSVGKLPNDTLSVPGLGPTRGVFLSDPRAANTKSCPGSDLGNDMGNVLMGVTSALLAADRLFPGYLGETNVASVSRNKDLAKQAVRASCEGMGGMRKPTQGARKYNVISAGDSQSFRLGELLQISARTLRPCLTSALGSGAFNMDLQNAAVIGHQVIALFNPVVTKRYCKRGDCRWLPTWPHEVDLLPRQADPDQKFFRDPQYQDILPNLFQALSKRQSDLVYVKDAMSLLPTNNVTLVVADIVRLIFNMVAKGVPHVAFFTTSPFQGSKQHEMQVYTKAIAKFAKTKSVRVCKAGGCHPSPGEKRVAISLVQYHRLVCPTYKEGSRCPHSVYGFSGIYEDKVHPSGESGEFFGSHVFHIFKNLLVGENPRFDKALETCTNALHTVNAKVDVRDLYQTSHYIVQRW